MLLNEKKFYQEIANFYEIDNYDGLQVYLENKEKEIKQEVMPDPGCVMCGGGDVDENGIAEVTKSWIKDRNYAIAVITYEQGRLLERCEKWDESIERFKEAIKLMERSKMTDLRIYEASVDSIKIIEQERE